MSAFDQHVHMQLYHGEIGRLLQENPGATLYHFGLLWRDSPDSETSTSMGPYLDKEQGEREFAQTLVNLGYTKPRWWQYWRWSENGPSKNVLALMAGMKPAKLQEGNME